MRLCYIWYRNVGSETISSAREGSLKSWLQDLGFGGYAEAFETHLVDEDVQVKLTAEDLMAIGVTAVGDRRRLLDAIEKEKLRRTREWTPLPSALARRRGRSLESGSARASTPPRCGRACSVDPRRARRRAVVVV